MLHLLNSKKDKVLHYEMPIMNIPDKFMEHVHCRDVEKQWFRQPVWEVSNIASHSSSVHSLACHCRWQPCKHWRELAQANLQDSLQTDTDHIIESILKYMPTCIKLTRVSAKKDQPVLTLIPLKMLKLWVCLGVLYSACLVRLCWYWENSCGLSKNWFLAKCLSPFGLFPWCLGLASF